MAIVRNIQNNMIYRYVGNDTYVNIVTGKSGEVSPDLARSIFKISLELTEILNQYPLVEEMITKLRLLCDKPQK